MGRNKGTFNFSANLEVRTAAPLDPRLVVDSASDLVLASTWDGGDGKAWLYDGMVVSIKDTHKLVMLTNYDPETAADAYQTASNWVEVDASAARVNVIDNLTSDSVTDPLSANQGKVLKTEIDTLKANLSSALNYKGSKDTFANLPTNASNGDVYNVVEANGNIPAGTNYAWNGTEWDPLGGTIDLSGYATKDELNDQKNAYEAADIALGKRIDTLSNTINNNNENINSTIAEFKVKDLGTSTSNLVSLNLDADGKLTVSDSISGVSIKVGNATKIPNVTAETAIKGALEEVYDAITVKEVSTTSNVNGINLTLSNGTLGLNANQNNIIKSLCGLTEAPLKGTINGVNIKLGNAITSTDSEGHQVEVYGENMTLATVLQNMNDSIKSAIAESITDINAGGGIEVTGDTNTKTIKVKVANGSALKIDENNALAFVWEEIE